MAKKYPPPKKITKKRNNKTNTVGASHKQATDIAERYFIVFAVAFFLLALFIRVIYVFSLRHLPLFDELVMDPAYHEKIALLIANGDWLAGREPLYRSPFYMYVLGIVYKIFGVDYLIPRLFGALTGSISIVLLMITGKKLFGSLSAVIAGLIAVFCWPLIYFDAELLTTSFTIMMGLILLLIFIRVWTAPTALNMIGFGLFFGITALTRENYFPIIGVVFLFFIVMRREVVRPLLFVVAALLAISPATIRNYVVLDDFVPITHYTGVNFYIGNNPYSDGRTAILPYTRADWYGGVEDVGKVTEKHLNRPPKPSDISAFWGKETFKYIFNEFFTCDVATMTPTPTLFDEPAPPPRDGKCRAFLPTAIKKFFFIFDLREYSNNKEMYFFRDQSAVLAAPIFKPFAGFLYIPLGLLGIFLAIRARNKAVIPLYVILVGYIIGLSLGFVNSRIRMPIVVMLIIFSGYAISYLWSDRQRLWQWLGGVAAVAGILLLINMPKPGYAERATLAGHFMLGNAYVRKGDLDQAEAHYQKSVKLTVSEYQSRTLAGLAEIELQRGIGYAHSENLTLAVDHFRRSLQYRESSQVLLNIANIFINSGGEDPLPYIQRALQLAPESPYVYLSFAQYFKKTGTIEQVRQNLQRARALNKNDIQVELFAKGIEEEIGL